MKDIFVSYRRSDSSTAVGRIIDRLEDTFGKDRVFRDIDAIEPGEDVQDVITDALQQCKVLLVVIGKEWLSVVNKAGEPRLADAGDWVRLEVSTALKNNIRVMPVLVDGADIPSADQLPSDLKSLPRRNAACIRDDPDFTSDMQLLSRAITACLRNGDSVFTTLRNHFPLIIAGASTLGLIAYFGNSYWGPSTSSSPDSQSTTSEPFVEKETTVDTPLVVGNVQARSDGSTSIAISNNGRISTVPITLIIDLPRDEPRHYDYSILFDITNASATEMRLVDIFVRTLEWSPLEQIVRYKPAMGIGKTRRFFGTIDKESKNYRARLPDDGSFLKLSPGELDTVELMISARSEGKYRIQIELEYSVGGTTDKVVIGPIEDVRFLDPARIDTLPR